MGFLARRTPSAPAAPPSPIPETARIIWDHTQEVGWNRVPADARRALLDAGHATGEVFVAGTWAPTTRRDRDGHYWLDTDAWWIDTATLLTVRAREALTRHGTGPDGRPRLRRAGGGRVEVTTCPLTGPPPSGQRWSRPTGAADVAGPAAGVRLTEHVVDVLPQAVRAELAVPTGQSAIRHYPPHGGYRDQVLAFRRISVTELVAVAAVREAGAYPDPDTAIDSADWHITTYRPQVGAHAAARLAM